MSSVTGDRRNEETSKPVAHSIAEQVSESAKGEDRPMEEVHPHSPGAVVWFTYPVLLIAALLIMFACVGLWYSN